MDTQKEFHGLRGERREQCEGCGQWWYWDEVLRQQAWRRLSNSENYIYRSDYNASSWSCDAVDKGEITRADSKWYLQIDAALHSTATDATTPVNAVQTWEGSGEMHAITDDYSAITGWTTAIVWCCVGVTASLDDWNVFDPVTFEIGLRAVGGTKYAGTRPSFLLSGDSIIWTMVTLSDTAVVDVGVLVPYIEVTTTNSEYWWVKNLALQKDRTTPGPFMYTEGTVRTRAADTDYVGNEIFCPKCKGVFKWNINTHDHVSEPHEYDEVREDFREL